VNVNGAKEFDELIGEAAKDPSKIVVIDFYTRWCKSCKQLYPTLCKMAKSRPDIVFVKVSGDGNRALLKRQGVSGFPHFQIYRNHNLLTEFHILPKQKDLLVENVAFIAKHPDEDHFKLEKGRVTVAPASIIQPDVKPPSSNPAFDLNSLLYSEEDSDIKPVSPQETFDLDSLLYSTEDAGGGPLQSSADRKEANMEFAAPQWTPAAAAKINFLSKYGDLYGYDGYLDEIYDMEVGERMHADNTQHHYLDYTGASIYTNSQIKAVFKDLERHLYGNPHSANPSSSLTGEEVDMARDMVLDFFNAPPGNYHVIFTKGATAALKLVGETFPWEKEHSEFLYLRENHNSVLGIREYAHLHDTKFHNVTEDKVDAWLRTTEEVTFDNIEFSENVNFGAAPLESSTVDWASGDECDSSSLDSNSLDWGAVKEPSAESAETSDDEWWNDDDEEAMQASLVDDNHYSLFAFPAEDNFSGVKYDLSWVEKFQQRSKGFLSNKSTRWKVLVDAAAYAPTQPLDLSKTPADFVTLSFYKIFGYPTGLGALIMRTENNDILKKVFWGGGSVKLASSDTDFHILECEPSSKLEDGTIAFLDIVTLKHGFNAMKRVGGITRIQAHVRALTEYAYDSLSALKHFNGKPLLNIFGNHHLPNRHDIQGGILNFNVMDSKGDPIGYTRVQKESAAAGFHIRTGSSCNPGACYNNLHIRPKEVEQMAGFKESCGDDTEWMFVQRGGVADHPLNPDGEHAVMVSSEDEIEDVMEIIKKSKVALGHEGEVALHWEKVPLGTVRMSLGWMSTFEDVYEFVQWMKVSYVETE